jgi:hypothetical protein
MIDKETLGPSDGESGNGPKEANKKFPERVSPGSYYHFLFPKLSETRRNTAQLPNFIYHAVMVLFDVLSARDTKLAWAIETVKEDKQAWFAYQERLPVLIQSFIRDLHREDTAHSLYSLLPPEVQKVARDLNQEVQDKYGVVWRKPVRVESTTKEYFHFTACAPEIGGHKGVPDTVDIDVSGQQFTQIDIERVLGRGKIYGSFSNQYSDLPLSIMATLGNLGEESDLLALVDMGNHEQTMPNTRQMIIEDIESNAFFFVSEAQFEKLLPGITGKEKSDEQKQAIQEEKDFWLRERKRLIKNYQAGKRMTESSLEEVKELIAYQTPRSLNLPFQAVAVEVPYGTVRVVEFDDCDVYVTVNVTAHCAVFFDAKDRFTLKSKMMGGDAFQGLRTSIAIQPKKPMGLVDAKKRTQAALKEMGLSLEGNGNS